MKYLFLSFSIFSALLGPQIARAEDKDANCQTLINQFGQLANFTNNQNIVETKDQVLKAFPHFCSVEETAIWFIQGGLVLAATAAIIFVIIGGFQIIVGSRGGESEGVAKGKKTLLYAIIGLAVILLAWVIVSAVTRIIFSGGKL